MNNRPRTLCTLAALACVVGGVSLPRSERAAAQSSATEKHADPNAKPVESPDKPPRPHVHLRLSQMGGMLVKSPQNKELGAINDIMVDLETGRIAYLAVSYGGFLGLGDKLFAIPYEAFQVHQDNESHSYFLVLDISEARLKAAPGFNQANWPNTADPEWSEAISKYYGNGKTTEPKSATPKP